jgi:hypothetical protein
VLKSRERRQLSRRLVVDVEAASEPGRPRGHERHEGCRENTIVSPCPNGAEINSGKNSLLVRIAA